MTSIAASECRIGRHVSWVASVALVATAAPAAALTTVADAPLQQPATAARRAPSVATPVDSPGVRGRATESAVRRMITAVRTAAPPTIDGRLIDEAWQLSAPAGGFVQRAPDAGAAATQSTSVRVLYDDAAVYVALRMHDDAPDSIVARLGRRDEVIHSDWVHVQIGSMDDGRTAYVFGVNPRGVQRDVLISEDGTRDAGWNAVWESATSVDEGGWSAELRIPLSQLRFQHGATQWAFNVERLVARRDETSHWSPSPPDAAGLVSHFGRLSGLEGLVPPRRLEVQPYTVARVTRSPRVVDNPLHERHALFGTAGADVRYGVTGALTLTATINPDFGQVEADPAEMNLTAYESFVQERRPFFVEGAELFRAPGPTLFYSRRIGRTPRAALPGAAVHQDYPTATSILGAAKLTGRLGAGWSIGALAALTAPEHARFLHADGTADRAIVEPLTSYGVVRLRREGDRGRSAVGVLATAVNRDQDGEARLELVPHSAYAMTVDGRRRIGDNHEVFAAVSGSAVLGSERALTLLQRSSARRFQRPDAAHVDLDSTRTSMFGHAVRLNAARIGGGPWRWGAGVTAIAPGFEVNDAGYQPSVDRVRTLISGAYERHRGGRRLRSGTLSTFLISEWTYGGERRMTVLDVDATFLLQSHRGGQVWVQREAVGLSVDALRGGPAVVAPGMVRAYAGGHTDRRRPLSARGSLYVQREDDTGSLRSTVSAALQVRPSTALEASLGARLQNDESAWHHVRTVSTTEGDRYVVAALRQRTAALTARASWALSPHLSVQFYAEPFMADARFSGYGEVVAPRAARFADRFHEFAPGDIEYDASRSRYTATRTGMAPLVFGRPDFQQTSLRSTAVLRWQYRPGSTLFVVWGSDREAAAPGERLDLRRDALGLFRTPGTNTLLIKASYWIGL